jgi:hypothetical protein
LTKHRSVAVESVATNARQYLARSRIRRLPRCLHARAAQSPAGPGTNHCWSRCVVRDPGADTYRAVGHRRPSATTPLPTDG